MDPRPTAPTPARRRQRASLRTYDDANQIATFGGTSFTYDDNGNLTSDGVRSYTWNARNQLASLTGPVNGSFAYDGVGRRRAKTIGGTTTQFLYDGLNPVQELSSGTPTANLLTGLGIDEYFTRADVAGVRTFLADALGSTVGLADGSGSVQTEYSYEPFGARTTSGAAAANTFGFTGREDDGTGLQYYRARLYDPKVQRFISEDPLDIGGGDVNLYRYVRNSPQQFIDPLGLCVPIPPVAVSCLPPAIVLTGEFLLWLTGTGVAVWTGQELADLLNPPAQSSDLEGDDPGYEQDRLDAIKEARDALRDPNSTAKERSQAKKRLEELMRRAAKNKHGADKSRGSGGKGGGSGRNQGGAGGGKGGGGGSASGPPGGTGGAIVWPPRRK